MEPTEEMDRALARAVLCRALQWGLQAPSPRSAEAFSCAEGSQVRRQAAEALDGEGAGLVAAVATLEGAGGLTLGELGDRHEAIFGHSLRGKVCPYETEYGGDALFQQGQELADISGYYLAFGLSPPDAGAERVDHVACEFEFLQFLALKEAYALQERDAEMLEVTRQAYSGFMRNHVARFGRAFGAALAAADAGGFYGAMGGLCVAFLETECLRIGLPPGPELLPLRPVEDGVPMACGEVCGREGPTPR